MSEAHFEQLYEQLDKDDLWDYMLNEPFPNREAFDHHYTRIINDKSSPTIYFTVLDKLTDRFEGLIALMDVKTQHRSLEIGHVIFSPALQKQIPATEAIYLALNYSFLLGFNRVVWKCNDLNEPSKKAARRLGFQYEGVHNQHMIVKGRVRDTAWFALTQDTWPPVKTTLETWLLPENFTPDGMQKKSLQFVREWPIRKDKA